MLFQPFEPGNGSQIWSRMKGFHSVGTDSRKKGDLYVEAFCELFLIFSSAAQTIQAKNASMLLFNICSNIQIFVSGSSWVFVIRF